MFPSLKAGSPTRRREKAPNYNNKSRQNNTLKSILSDREEAQTNPKLMHQSSSDKSNEDRKRGRYKKLAGNKNIFYDEFTGMFRCKKLDERLIEVAVDLSFDLQEVS